MTRTDTPSDVRQIGRQRLVIRGLACVSPFGCSLEDLGARVHAERCFSAPLSASNPVPVVPLHPVAEALVEAVAAEERCKRLDRVAQMAIAAARMTLRLRPADSPPIGCVSIGSSRGATATLENTIGGFLSEGGAQGGGTVPPYTSPLTTAGNISSWIGQEVLELGLVGDGGGLASLSTSMTCTSGFHSLLVALGFVRGGLAEAALFGGAESCLTPYTISQLEALRIYTKARHAPWPGRPLAREISADAQNSLMLGEGAGTAILERYNGKALAGDMELLGTGWQLERIPSATGVSTDGAAFEGAMRLASSELSGGTASVDAVIAHAPGTVRGDEAELAAIRRVFGGALPIFSTKHITGHTYGASGLVSLHLAQYLLSREEGWPGFPYEVRVPVAARQGSCSRILINTAGFGGNVISIVVGAAKPNPLG